MTEMTEITVAKTLPASIERFVVHWGEMGTVWGVNRSVAQIHALLYLCDEPLTADDIAAQLAMARSNVSVSLRELLGWSLIRRVHAMGDRRDYYEAEADMFEMVRRIAAGDRTGDDPASPRQVLATLYGKPPFVLPTQLEDELVGAMLDMATGDDFYPGDAVVSANWPGTAPGTRGVNNAISPRFCDVSGFAQVTDRPDVLWVRGDSDQIVSDVTTAVRASGKSAATSSAIRSTPGPQATNVSSFWHSGHSRGTGSTCPQ